RVGSKLRDAQIMHTATVGVTEKEDREEGIHEQDVFDGVVLFLAAITLRLFSRVLGADDAPLGAVIGKRGEAGAAAGPGATRAGVSSSASTTVTASASATPSRWAKAVRERAGHHRGRGAPPAVLVREHESTDALCSAPCRTSVPGRLGAHTF